jgi:hypothetical protein
VPGGFSCTSSAGLGLPVAQGNQDTRELAALMTDPTWSRARITRMEALDPPRGLVNDLVVRPRLWPSAVPEVDLDRSEAHQGRLSDRRRLFSKSHDQRSSPDVLDSIDLAALARLVLGGIDTISLNHFGGHNRRYGYPEESGGWQSTYAIRVVDTSLIELSGRILPLMGLLIVNRTGGVECRGQSVLSARK